LKTPNRKTLEFRVVGHKLPGLRYDRSAGAQVDREPVYVGIQRKNEVIDLVRGDASRAAFNFPVDVEWDSKALDFRGSFVFGVKGKRFVYLSWGEVSADGTFTMFRRAKLHLSLIKKRDVMKALSSTASPTVEGAIDLTDDEGGPLCGTVTARLIKWRVRG